MSSTASSSDEKKYTNLSLELKRRGKMKRTENKNELKHVLIILLKKRC